MVYRKKRDKEVRKYLRTRFEMIDTIDDNYFKAICYFAIIESFAQEFGNYEKTSTAAFCDFVLRFQSSYVFLDKLDPVTLFYDFEDDLKNDFDLQFLNDKESYNVIHAIVHGHADEMKKFLLHHGKDEKRINKHQYVRLLYSLRSKLSHELSSHNGMLSTNCHLLPNFPYYVSTTRSYCMDDIPKIDNVWEPVFPVGFIKKLTAECIDKYLEFSIQNKNDPFENDTFTRKSKIAWYD